METLPRAAPVLEGRSSEERGLKWTDDLSRVAQPLGATAAAGSKFPDSPGNRVFSSTELRGGRRPGIAQIETCPDPPWGSDHSLKMFQRK